MISRWPLCFEFHTDDPNNFFCIFNWPWQQDVGYNFLCSWLMWYASIISTSRFITLLKNRYSDRLLSLLRQFLHIPNKVKKFFFILEWIALYKKKVKGSRYRPGVAQRVGRGIALFFHNRGTRRGWVVSSTPRPQFTPENDTVPILQEAGWAPGPVWTGGKSHPNRDSIPDCPARSQSL